MFSQEDVMARKSKDSGSSGNQQTGQGEKKGEDKKKSSKAKKG
jgi:hypothetical protein